MRDIRFSQPLLSMIVALLIGLYNIYIREGKNVNTLQKESDNFMTSDNFRDDAVVRELASH